MVFPPSGICEEMILAHFGYTMYCLGFGYTGKLYHTVVLSTPRHERGSNSQI
jgi:hypothetical protein